MQEVVASHLSEIRAACAKHGVERLFVFGSSVNGDFDPATSDVDFVVKFLPQQRSGFDDVYFKLRADLIRIVGRPVDLIEAQAVKNPYFIAAVNRTKRMLYAA